MLLAALMMIMASLAWHASAILALLGLDKSWLSFPCGTSSRPDIIAYQPLQIQCPLGPLIRIADSLSPSEEHYISRRKQKADVALTAWLNSLGGFSNDKQPTIAFASSGGGLRAFLQAAGILQAFDGRDGTHTTNGLLQAISYHAGISGGSWLVSALAGNDWPTISELKSSLKVGLQNLIPANASAARASPLYDSITADVQSKEKAGFSTTIADPFGRFVAHAILRNPSILLSSITTMDSFRRHEAPLPLFTSVGTRVMNGECFPNFFSPQYEHTPFEFGSWDSGIRAFTSTRYLGTRITAGKPDNMCTTNFDNLGFSFSASANVWPKFDCFGAEQVPIALALKDTLAQVHPAVPEDIYTVFPNPFYKSESSPTTRNDTELFLTDGGFWGSDIPVWPFIQKARQVDVIIVADTSEDTPDSFPNGVELRLIYDRAKDAGLEKMPWIPAVDEFVREGLNTRATFFGCGQNTSIIVYLPNVAYSFPSNQSSLRVSYPEEDMAAMIANGGLIGTQNNDLEWPLCLGCAIKHQDGPTRLPTGCVTCFDRYCYNEAR